MAALACVWCGRCGAKSTPKSSRKLSLGDNFDSERSWPGRLLDWTDWNPASVYVIFKKTSTWTTRPTGKSLVYFFIDLLACQPGVARAFALRAELRRFAPLAGSAHLSRFAITCTQARDELLERLLFRCSSGVTRAFALRATCTCTWCGLLKWQYFALLCTCVSFNFEKSQLRLVRKGSDQTSLRSIMRSYDRSCAVRFWIFLPDRSSKYWQTEPRKLWQNCPRLQKAYIFKVELWARILRARQERQESFRAWAASKGMFMDCYSYW